MKESTKLSIEEQMLIGALQVAPRAPWSAIGEALGISAVTAARHWQRIADEGTAWVTASPGIAWRAEQCLAYVEINCAPAQRLDVATKLAQHDLVVSVELTTGSADMLLTIAVSDLATLAHYLLEHLGVMENILNARARVATKLYKEGSSWRLFNFDQNPQRILERARLELEAGPRDANPITMTQELKEIARLLAMNGRASYSELASLTGISATSVRRHTNRLIRGGIMLPRTDVSAELSEWPVQVYFWADAPIDLLADSAKMLSRFRQVRLCATVTAASNLVLSAWLRTVEEVHRLELAISLKLPQVRIVDRLIVLRTVKRMGRLIDAQGRAVGVVPINIWEHPLEHPAP